MAPPEAPDADGASPSPGRSVPVAAGPTDDGGPPPGSAPAVVARGLTKDYTDFWGRPRVRALAGLDLEVRRGEVFGLLGPNGSGKTTTMKLVLGLLRPTSGEARVLGRAPHESPARARIGFLPEETYLHKFLTGEETLEFHGRLFDLPREVRRRRTEELLEKVGLAGARGRRLREYSRGMGRRIGLAQALVNDPELVLLDEPTAGLDPMGAREVKDLILDLRGRGKTVLLSSHLLADVEDVCDRIAILHEGRVRLSGGVDDVLTRRDEIRFTARGVSEADAQELERLLRERASLVRVDRPRETLETVFLRETGEDARAADPAGGTGTL